jgi:hypothetical protein
LWSVAALALASALGCATTNRTADTTPDTTVNGAQQKPPPSNAGQP